MSKKIIEKDLENVVDSLNLDELSDEEKEILLQDALQEFEKIPGVEFEDISDNDEQNLNNDFKTTRKVLVKNINRLEKLTQICINNVAIDQNNIGMLQTSLGVITESSKALKLLAELQGKLFTNKQQAKKVNEEQSDDKPNNNLPDGWSVK